MALSNHTEHDGDIMNITMSNSTFEPPVEIHETLVTTSVTIMRYSMEWFEKLMHEGKNMLATVNLATVSVLPRMKEMLLLTYKAFHSYLASKRDSIDGVILFLMDQTRSTRGLAVTCLLALLLLLVWRYSSPKVPAPPKRRKPKSTRAKVKEKRRRFHLTQGARGSSVQTSGMLPPSSDPMEATLQSGSNIMDLLSPRSDSSNMQQRSRFSTEEISNSNNNSNNNIYEWDPNLLLPAFDGPNVPSITYTTWTPPTKWTEASKQLIPANTKPKPRMNLIIDLKEGKLVMDDNNAKSSFDLTKINVLVQTPAEGGVLELHHQVAAGRDSNNDNSSVDRKQQQNSGTIIMEHTFETANEAAQFQHDLLGYQIVGERIMNMYQALELIHKGSMAHNGPECVLHNSVGEHQPTPGAVAWDDVMRCLGCATSLTDDDENESLSDDIFRSIRSTLERRHPQNRRQHLYSRGVGVEDENEKEQAAAQLLPSLHEDYHFKRTLLGPVDFFRLFLPALPSFSVPQAGAHRPRMDTFLKIRKDVAKASLWVRSYVRARTIVNKGWKPEWDQHCSQRRRLAYDENYENIKHDSAAKNEYYEATVSRDVYCEVSSRKIRGLRNSIIHAGIGDQTSPSQRSSPYQAYAMVGSHTFRRPQVEGDDDHPLIFTKDPVESIPSLRALIRRHPEADFFVNAYFPEKYPVAVVSVFVRSLPKGAEPGFDRCLERFKHATQEERNNRLQIFLQLGPGSSLSSWMWAGIRLISAFGIGGVAPYERTFGERTVFPRLRLSNFMEMKQFEPGWPGDEQREIPNMPRNYFASTVKVTSKLMQNYLGSALYRRLEDDRLPKSVLDISIVVEGDNHKEMPERCLISYRLVNIDPLKCALPPEYSYKAETMEEEDDEEEEEEISYAPVEGLIAAASRRRILLEEATAFTSVSDNDTEHHSVALDNDTAFQQGADALADILTGVQVPFRKDGLTHGELASCSDMVDDHASSMAPPASRQHEMVNLPILVKVSHNDLRRFFQAEDCDLKAAAVRVAQSVGWRGITFPIDTRACRLELQSGQFFQQGYDLRGHPVFYFRNMCAGPWRHDEDAVIAAVLHRLEKTLNRMKRHVPGIRLTLVVLMGKPKLRKKGDDDNASTTAGPSEADEESSKATHETSNTKKSKAANQNPFVVGVNPRLPHTGEEFTAHSNPNLARRLLALVMKHYPEHLYKAIIAPGKRRGYGHFGTAVGAQLALHSSLVSARTRSRCFILHSLRELREYIAPEELVTIAGGHAPIHPSAFEST